MIKFSPSSEPIRPVDKAISLLTIVTSRIKKERQRSRRNVKKKLEKNRKKP